jgi:xanthine dehydrogenase accessory factor
MSFTDALYCGKAELDGVLAKHARTVPDLAMMVECGRAIPMIDLALESALSALRPNVLVDARMRKHYPSDPQRGLAPLTIGLGPTFEAGRTIDVVVETAWGDRLGDVITSGRTSELAWMIPRTAPRCAK